jgi:hypothetical protein
VTGRVEIRRMQSSWLAPLAAIGVVFAVALAPSVAISAEPVNMEGTWKISAPQTAFKPETGAVPFTAQGRKRYQENKRALAEKRFDDFDYVTGRCASPGMPRLMITPQRIRVWQRPGIIMMQFEWNRLLRQIDMGGLIKPQLRMEAGTGPLTNEDALIGRATPISKGQWEGDTLVVTSEGFADNTLIDNLIPHGYDLKLTERIRLRGADVLEDRIRIEDPETFARAWETVVTYRRVADEAFPENVCLDSLPASQATE